MNDPGKIRNIALVGHRGTGKTSLLEALLFRAGVVNRLGKVEEGTTVSDFDDDEKKRQLSLSGTLVHIESKASRSTSSILPATRASWPTRSPPCASSRRPS